MPSPDRLPRLRISQLDVETIVATLPELDRNTGLRPAWRRGAFGGLKGAVHQEIDLILFLVHKASVDERFL